MAQENGYFNGPKETKIFYQCWLPQTEAGAVLIAVHGLAEHSGRYMNLVNSLVPQGFSVYAQNHYGHGKSGGKRLFVPDFKLFTRTLDQFIDQVKE
ncbi:MAG: alpha/beta hydrolase [Desulfobacter sp.]|nr:MAG: alpha/beta hydrolase [Desulfobacter sp.]